MLYHLDSFRRGDGVDGVDFGYCSMITTRVLPTVEVLARIAAFENAGTGSNPFNSEKSTQYGVLVETSAGVSCNTLAL